MLISTPQFNSKMFQLSYFYLTYSSNIQMALLSLTSLFLFNLHGEFLNVLAQNFQLKTLYHNLSKAICFIHQKKFFNTKF